MIEPRRVRLLKQPYFQNLRSSEDDLVCLGAEDEARTRDPNLGKVVLYQLSYFCRFFPNGIAKVRRILKLPNLFAKKAHIF